MGPAAQPSSAALRSLLEDPSPDIASALMKINQSQSDMIGTILAPNGLTMDDGKLVDSAGRSGSYADVVEDPYRPGSYDIEP